MHNRPRHGLCLTNVSEIRMSIPKRHERPILLFWVMRRPGKSLGLIHDAAGILDVTDSGGHRCNCRETSYLV
jgi:hypothetical protein